jgi:outer membrane biosynthesis protein TonB
VAVLVAIMMVLACRESPTPVNDPTPRTSSSAARAAEEQGEPPASQGTRREPMRVGGEVTAPVVIKRVQPDVTPCTQETIRVKGPSLIEVVIDERGIPRDARILDTSNECLDRLMLKAVEQWRFRPGTFRGEPVPVFFNMTVNIHLD